MAKGVLRLRRDRLAWSETTLDGRTVLVSEAVGPAVVGLRRPKIVVPNWVLDMPPSDRELLLRHEEAHLGAGDSRLFATAVALLTLLPWNLPLWWMIGRLKLALEIDCDRRVLRRDTRVRPYASLLIGLAERDLRPRLATLAFTASVPFLERRIRAMTEPGSHSRKRAVAWSTCAALLVVAACRVDQPAITSPESGNDAIEAFDVRSEAPSPFVAQVRFDRGAVAGVLRDRESGRPLENVEVSLAEGSVWARTNAAGRFLLLNVPQGGVHTILARHPRLGVFRIARVEVSGTPGEERGPAGVFSAPDDDVGVITGTVRSADSGARLMDATVHIEATGIGARTNSAGRYLLLNVPAGEHTLVIERDGYEAERRTVDVRGERESTVVDVELRRN